MGPRPAEKAIESSSTFYGKGGIGLSPRASSRGSLLPKHANGIGRGYKWRVVVRCYGYPEDLSFFVSRSWKLNDSREREREREMATSLFFLFFFFIIKEISPFGGDGWRGTKVFRVRFLEKEKVANASLPSIDLRFFIFSFLSFLFLPPLLEWVLPRFKII